MARRAKEEVYQEKVKSNADFIKKLNTKFGKGVAKTLNESENTNVKEFISTGSKVLDIYCANKPEGGFPVGRLSTVEGEEQTGKSLMAAHAAVDTLKRNGTVIYIDNEHAVDRAFFKRIGVDDKKLIYVDGLDYMEQVFELIEMASIEHRNENPDDLFTIIWDSVASTPTKAEIMGDFEAKTMGEAARILSTNIKKILKTIDTHRVCLIAVNQLRMKFARPGERVYGDMLIPTGGKAVPYYATVRIRLKKSGNIKDNHEVILGVYANAKVIKTRLGPPFRSCDLNIYFSHGIDDKGAWLEVLKKYDIVKKADKTHFACQELFGDKKFQTPDWDEVMKNIDFKNKTEELLKKHLVVDYDNVDVGELIVDNIDPDSYEEVKTLANEMETK